jgi:spore germination protein GerM
VAGAVAGCGVPASGHLQRIDPSTVPFNLLSTAPPGTKTPESNGPATAIFFVRDDRLVTAKRHVVAEVAPVAALRSLFVGPTPIEAARGLTTDVPAQTRLISLDLAGPVATVDLSSEFSAVGGSEQVLAVAQIVYTLTASPDISAVQFAIDGETIEVPDGSGSLSDTPRRRGDYPDVAPH